MEGIKRTIEVNGIEVQVKEQPALKIVRQVNLITTREMANVINGIMKGIFSDYRGTGFRLVNGKLMPLFWFDVNERTDCTGLIKGMVASEEKENKHEDDTSQKWANTFNNMNRRISGKYTPYKLSDGAKEVLGIFNPLNYKWNSLVSFRDRTPQQGTIYGTPTKETLMKVSGLDIISILKFIYGETREVDFDERNPVHRMEYRLMFKNYLDDNDHLQLVGVPGMRIMGNDEDGDRRNMLFELNITDVDVANQISGGVGLYPANDTAPIF